MESECCVQIYRGCLYIDILTHIDIDAKSRVEPAASHPCYACNGFAKAVLSQRKYYYFYIFIFTFGCNAIAAFLKSDENAIVIVSAVVIRFSRIFETVIVHE